LERERGWLFLRLVLLIDDTFGGDDG